MVQIETYDYNEKVVLCVVPNSPNTMIILLTCIEPGQSIFTTLQYQPSCFKAEAYLVTQF